MQIITLAYHGHAIAYQDDGWFNATQAAARFDKLPTEWLRLAATVEYLNALSDKYGQIPHLKTKRGATGGTWFHPRLAVPFARWLDAKFAVWCDEQIDQLVHGSGGDWRKLRHGAASSNKVVNAMLQEVRAAIGKETTAVQYMSEAKLINWAHSGEFAGLTRDALSTQELDLLQFLELKNATLLGRGIAYADRKPMLKQYAIDWRLSHVPAISAEPAKAV